MAKEVNDFNTSVGALLKGLEGFVSSKTVVGEPITVNDAVIVPLVDMKFGIGAGSFDSDKKNNTAGGANATINPCAVLVIQNGMTKIIGVHNQDVASKVLDLVPDLVNRFTSKGKTDPEVEQAAEEILKKD